MKTSKYNVLKHLNTKIHPGNDFFGYVNSDWKKKNPIPQEYAAWSTFSDLAQRVREELHVILNGLNKKKYLGSKEEQKLRDYYRSGIDIKSINRHGIKPLQKEIEKIQSIEKKKQLTEHIAYLHAIDIDVFWTTGISIDHKKSAENIIYPYQGGLGLPNRDYYLKKTKEMITVRKQYALHIKRLTKLVGLSPKEGKRIASNVMRIEKKLAEKSMPPAEERKIEKWYKKYTYVELKKMAPAISWDEYIKAIGIEKIYMAKVVVAQPDFMKEVSDIIKKQTLQTIKDYLLWHLLSSSSNYLAEQIAEERFSFIGNKLSGSKKILPRWKRVVAEIDSGMGEELGKLYVKKYFPPAAKRKMKVLVKDLFDAYQKRIKKLDWMGPKTKKQALKKLSTIQTKIGYPNTWKSYRSLKITPENSYLENHWAAAHFSTKQAIKKLGKPVNKKQWLMTPPTVNAYYWGSLNEIVFPAGILQPPFFDIRRSDAMNYGAIGSVIGHELTHGFDDNGSKKDEKGNLKNWWAKKDRVSFMKKADKLIEQYDKSEIFKGLFGNGQLTLGENIADLGGAVIAFDALQKRIGDDMDTKKGEYTPRQEFFIGFAHQEAGEWRRKEATRRTTIDPHSHHKLRVNNVLQHIDAFYEAFDVKPEHKLYRKEKDRIKIW